MVKQVSPVTESFEFCVDNYLSERHRRLQEW